MVDEVTYIGDAKKKGSKSSSNVGQTGFESIRIGGMTIDELPIAEAAHAKAQIPLVMDNMRQARIEEVIAKYPKGQVAYFKSRIEECKSAIAQQGTFKSDMAKKIAEYRGLFAGSQYRDEEIARLDPDGSIQEIMAKRGAERIIAENEGREPDYTGLEIDGETEAIGIQVRSLKVTYPPYDTEDIQSQINQFEEAIQRADEVIANEFISISELTGVLALAQQRDTELKALGVTIYG